MTRDMVFINNLYIDTKLKNSYLILASELNYSYIYLDLVPVFQFINCQLTSHRLI